MLGSHANTIDPPPNLPKAVTRTFEFCCRNFLFKLLSEPTQSSSRDSRNLSELDFQLSPQLQKPPALFSDLRVLRWLHCPLSWLCLNSATALSTSSSSRGFFFFRLQHTANVNKHGQQNLRTHLFFKNFHEKRFRRLFLSAGRLTGFLWTAGEIFFLLSDILNFKLSLPVSKLALVNVLYRLGSFRLKPISFARRFFIERFQRFISNGNGIWPAGHRILVFSIDCFLLFFEKICRKFKAKFS